MSETTQYRPRSVSPPGDTLVDLLEERVLTQVDLATRMGRPLKTINELVKGKLGITAETALQLERALGTPAHFWLSREALYRESLARKADAEQSEVDKSWLREIPLREMIKLRWVSSASDAAQQVGQCLAFFGVASVGAWRDEYGDFVAEFRKSEKTKSDIGAISAWLRKGELEAARISCRRFDRAAFLESLSKIRALTSESDPAVFGPELVRLCANAGVALVLVPAPKGCPASGATRWLSPHQALIQLSLRYKTNDQLWFTFFHEAGHILRHGKKLLFLEETGLDGEREVEADRFASDFLIPPPEYEQLLLGSLRSEEVVSFAHRLGIAPGIVVGRLQHDKHIRWSELTKLKHRYTWSLD